MKRKDLSVLVVASIVAILFAFVVSGAIFKTGAHKDQAPNIQVIEATFPDVKNDSTYNTFFYTGALDPTQPVQIGNSSNSQPF